MVYDHFNYCQRFLWLMLKAMPTGKAGTPVDVWVPIGILLINALYALEGFYLVKVNTKEYPTETGPSETRN